MSGTKVHDETLARHVMSEALRVRVHQLDGTRAANQLPDLEFQVPGGRGIAEVVSTRDSGITQQDVAMHRAGYTQEASLQRMWVVHLSRGALVRDVKAALPAFLSGLEAQGVYALHSLALPDDDKLPAGVSTGWSHTPTPKHPPGFYLLPEPMGGSRGMVTMLSVNVRSFYWECRRRRRSWPRVLRLSATSSSH